MIAHHEDSNPTLLPRRFPLMIEDPRDNRQWLPLASDLPRFLRYLWPRYANARDLVVELLQHLDYSVPTTLVRLSDATAARRTGIDRRNIQACRDSAGFSKWVRVCRGEVRRAGFTPLATVYDLHKLMLRYGSWHAAEERRAATTMEEDLQRQIDAAEGRGVPLSELEVERIYRRHAAVDEGGLVEVVSL